MSSTAHVFGPAAATPGDYVSAWFDPLTARAIYQVSDSQTGVDVITFFSQDLSADTVAAIHPKMPPSGWCYSTGVFDGRYFVGDCRPSLDVPSAYYLLDPTGASAPIPVAGPYTAIDWNQHTDAVDSPGATANLSVNTLP